MLKGECSSAAAVAVDGSACMHCVTLTIVADCDGRKERSAHQSESVSATGSTRTHRWVHRQC